MPMTLRLRQWIFLAAVMLLLGGGIGLHLYSEHQAVESGEGERLATQAKVIDENLGYQLRATNGALDSILRDLPFLRSQKDGKALVNRRLQSISEAMPGVRTLLILDAEGTAIESNREELVGKNFREREYFKVAHQGSNPATLHVMSPFKTVLGVFAMNVVKVIPNHRGEFAGLISATLDPEYFKILLDSVRYASDMRTSLIHADGMLFLIVPARPGMEGADVAVPGSFYSRHLASGQAATVLTGRLLMTGEERMVALRTIKPASLAMDKALVLSVARDLPGIFADWRRDAYLQGSLYLILLLTTTSGLYLYQKRLLEFNRLALTQSIGRKQVEDDLATEKDFIETALDSLVDTFFVFEPGTGKAIRWNKALKELTGYADEEIAALRTPEAYCNQDDQNKVASAIASVADGGKAVVELNLICKDGRTIPMEYVATTVKKPREKNGYIIAIGRNITERKQAEQVLRDSEARFRAIIEASPAPFVLNDERHNITYLNSAFTRTFGYTLDDIPTLSEWWPRAYPSPAYRQWVAATWQTYMEKARRENSPIEPFELNICCKDGSVRTVMADVEPVVMNNEQAHLVSFYDITERKHAELEILRTKNLLQATLDAIPDLLFEVGLDGHIYNYHAHRTDLLAAPPEVFLGKTFSAVLPAEVAQVCLSAIGEASRNGWSTGREYALQLPQGEFWFELSVAPMPASEGQERHFICLARDVTANKQQEQLHIEKERAHRITLVREVHHRIKNNLQSVAGLLRRELGQFAELDPRLETAISQVNIIAVVHGLQGAELHEATRLYEVVRNICTSVADLALRPVRFQEVAEDSAIRRIGIDKDEAVSVALVLNELVLNAVKHSPASGSAPRVALSAAADAVRVVICNATTAAPDFDIVSGKGISTGLSLVRSLMPEQGAELTYERDAQGELVTTLKLVSPVVFNPAEDG